MRLLTTSLFIALLAGAAFPQAGHWEANLQVPDRVIGLALDLEKNAKGEWIGSFGIPAQKIIGLAVVDLKVDGPSVKFKVAGLPGSPGFDLKLSGDSKLAGMLNSAQADMPLEFEKKGDAKVELPVLSPAVSKELEGDWSGPIETPNGTLNLVVHFKNQPDKTLLATMDSPDQGAKDLPLSAVVQKDLDVEFKLQIANAGFKGKLNKEGTELAGDWSQGGGSLPLKLKKK